LLNNPEQAFLIFPLVERDVPTVGMKRSQVGDKTFPSWVIGLPLRLSKNLFCAFIGDINGVGLHYLQRFYCKFLHLSTNLSKPA